MAKLRVDAEGFLGKIVKECTGESMMEYPQVDDIKDPEKRQLDLDAWKRGREAQLGFAEEIAVHHLKKAYADGYLEPNDYMDACQDCAQKFAGLREEADRKYKEAQAQDSDRQRIRGAMSGTY